MSHYVPKVSDLVKRLVSPSEKKVEEDLGQYLDVDDDDVSQHVVLFCCCHGYYGGCCCCSWFRRSALS